MNYDAYKEHTTFKKYFDKVSGAGIKGAKNYMERHKDKIEKIREAKRNDNEIQMSKKELKEFTERINHIREKKKKELTIDEFNELIARFNGRNTV